MNLLPNGPVELDGVALTAEQSARLGKLISCIHGLDPLRPPEQIVYLAVNAFRATIVRTESGWTTKAFVRMRDGAGPAMRVRQDPRTT